MFGRVVAAILLIAAAAILLVALWPQLLGLQDAPIIAQVVSLRGLDVAIALILVIIFGLVAIGWRRTRKFFRNLVILLLLFCLASAGILSLRGFGSAISGSATSTAGGATASDLTVLEWNTAGGAPGAAEIARLALAQHADILSLPETTLATGVAVEHIMKAAGRPMWVYNGATGYVYASHSTTLLISTALGQYHVDDSLGDTSVLASIVAEPDNGRGPTIVAVHAVAPKPDEMLNWRADLGFLSQRCAGSNLIMAGDFNSTLDELNSLSTKSGADFGDCSDAGAAAKTAAVGSWPTNLPTLLGAQIDHVMYAGAWKTVSFQVIQTEDQAGSDHRPIVAVLAPGN